jgi:hypothetical protein
LYGIGRDWALYRDGAADCEDAPDASAAAAADAAEAEAPCDSSPPDTMLSASNLESELDLNGR